MPRATPPPRLEIRLLGEPEVAVDGRVCALPASKKTRALLGYLVATGRPQRRERLCELLWDGPDDPRAGLRWSLAKLRPLIDVGGSLRIAANREHVSFECRGASVDVSSVQALSAGGAAALETGSLLAIAEQFRGPFLEGLELASCPAFHAWCIARREELRALHVSALETLVERLRGTPAQALSHARALVALDPLAESARLCVLELLTALGDTRRAFEEYDEYARMLGRELGVKPSLELERWRMALGRSPATVTGAPPVVDAAFASPPNARSLEVTETALTTPFVGRQRERDVLVRALDGAGQGRPVVLVLGEPGMGKSRLLEELGRLARERGGRVLMGRAFEAELVRPYGAFIDALRGGFPEPFSAANTGDLSPLLPGPSALPASDRTLLYDSVARLLANTARERAPLVVVLDDLHWFDEASTELLHYLARALRDSPIVFATSARGGELGDNPAAQRLVRALGRERLALSIELGPLSDAELCALLSHASPGVDAPRVLAESAGSPLFALEAARALASGAQDLVHSLSRLMTERLGRLQEAERGLLSWAGALGRSFDVDVLARVTGLSPPELVASLERLERHAILRVREFGYDFAHDLLRQAAYRQMSEPRRRLVHAHIARALSACPDPDGALASDVAHHASLAGDAGLAARACITAGRRCLRLFASRQAVDLAQRGLHLASSLPALERLPIAVELLALDAYAQQSHGLEASLVRLATEAHELGLPAVEARAFFLRSVLQFDAGDSKGAHQSSLSRIEATRHATPIELGQELAGTARCFLLLQRDIAGAEKFVGQARDILGESGEQLDLVWSQGMLAEAKGDLAGAAGLMRRAVLLARREDGHWEECECLLQLALIELDRGELDAAHSGAMALLEVARKLGEGAHAPVAESLAALTRVARRLEPHGRSALDAFDATLPALSAAGANRLLAIVLNRAAALALHAGAEERALRYAERALRAAERVERVNEMAEARALLAELSLRARETQLVSEHLDALSAHVGWPDLSARSAGAIERVRALASAEGALGSTPMA
jgi:DNA-binding SARP family transcriptional activator